MVLAWSMVAAAPARVQAAPVQPPAKLRICVDAGHGGGYSGASYGGILEKDLNLAIARELTAELTRQGHEVFMTRTGDDFVRRDGGTRTWLWSSLADSYLYERFPENAASDRLREDLQARCDVANRVGADLFVSIHNNAASSTTAQGAEIWYSVNDQAAAQYAKDVLAGVIAQTGAVDRGTHQQAFYVNRWTNMPSVLVECGFMSNPAERAQLATNTYQKKIAKGIADGIAAYAERSVDEPYDRLAGPDRYATAAAVSAAAYPYGASEVLLASGEQFPDSLVAGPLAYQLDAPILLTRMGVLPEATAAELGRLLPSRITIIGGPAAVAPSVATAAASAAGIDVGAVERIDGATRYDVALSVAKRVSPDAANGVVVASGTSWPDAVSVSAAASAKGEPILLCGPTGLRQETLAYLRGSSQGEALEITVVGSQVVVDAAALDGLPFTRLAGPDRYETNWAILNARYSEYDMMCPYVVSGEAFPDALVIGPYAARQGRPLLLSGKNRVSEELRPWVYANRSETFAPSPVGGPVAVSAYFSAAHNKWLMGN